MNVFQRITKNIFVLLVGQVVVAILGFAFMVYAARYLGVAKFGVFTFALAFVAIFNIFTDLGLSTLTTREIARNHSLVAKYLGNIAVLKLVLVTFTFGLIALIINLLRYPPETLKVVYMIAGSYILSAFSLMFYSVFNAHEKMELVTFGLVIESAVRLSGALFVIFYHWDILTLALIYVVSSATTLTYCAIITYIKFPHPKFEIDFSFWKTLLAQAWPLALAGLFSMVYYWFDSVMLSLMKDDAAVGIYNASYRIIIALMVISVSYLQALFPVMSKLHVSSREALQFTIDKSYKYLLSTAAPICVGGTIIAERIITLAYHSEYIKSVLVFQILVWTLLFSFIGGIFRQVLVSTNEQRKLVTILATSVILNIILNLLLIPDHSYVGASIATVITEFMALSIAYYYCVRLGYGILLRDATITTARVLVATVIMGVVVFLMVDRASLGLIIPVAALMYIVVLIILKGIDSEDLRILRRVVQSK